MSPGRGFQSGEHVVVDEDTGGRKGQKLARHDLVPAGPLTELAEHFGRGAEKYEPNNWRRGYAWSLNYAAAMRHLIAFWCGEDIDPETGTKHVIAAMWHCCVLAEFMETHAEKDDRPTRFLQEKDDRPMRQDDETHFTDDETEAITARVRDSRLKEVRLAVVPDVAGRDLGPLPTHLTRPMLSSNELDEVTTEAQAA